MFLCIADWHFMTDWTHRLRLRHLQMLLSLAETGNMSLSATALNTTQPALSKWIRELEEDIGLPLFERHARGLRPTIYGKSLIEHARRIEGHLDSARDDMLALRDSGSGLVVIGSAGASAAETVPVAVVDLLGRLPRAHVRILESTMDLLLPQLVRGEVDIVVGRSAPEHQDHRINVETLYMEPLHFVTRLRHPLAGQAAVGWDDLRAYRWIAWPRGTPMRNALDTALGALGRTLPADCVESDSLLVNLTLLDYSDMIALVSHRTARRLADLGALHITPLSLAGFGSISMYWRNEQSTREVVSAALAALRRTSGAP